MRWRPGRCIRACGSCCRLRRGPNCSPHAWHRARPHRRDARTADPVSRWASGRRSADSVRICPASDPPARVRRQLPSIKRGVDRPHAHGTRGRRSPLHHPNTTGLASSTAGSARPKVNKTKNAAPSGAAFSGRIVCQITSCLRTGCTRHKDCTGRLHRPHRGCTRRTGCRGCTHRASPRRRAAAPRPRRPWVQARRPPPS